MEAGAYYYMIKPVESDVIVEHCGDIYFMTGDVEGALKYWKKALEMGSESKTLKEKIEKKKYIAE